MNHRCHRPLPLLPLLVAMFALLAAAPMPAQGMSPGFAELYALADNRAEAVATLIPGTEDWYYYHCRERLDAGDFAAVRKALPAWIRRHGRTARVVEIENREALLSYSGDPERTFRHLRKQLGLKWAHQRSAPGEKSDLPTSLDPERLSPARLRKEALARHPGTVDGFTDRALPALVTANLTDDQVHDLLGRLRRPDIDNLPALVVRDLAHRQSRGFGSLGIHGALRLSQLEACVAMKPDLLNDPSFVKIYLTRLQPRTDIDWQLDPTAREKQLERLWRFAQRLNPSNNSLKAHILHHWLQHDLRRGTVDKERFLAYIRLPRKFGPVAREWHGQSPAEFVNRNQEFPTLLPPIGDDTTLIRSCLEFLFAREDSVAPYATYLDKDWLENVLAETKLLLGQGDMERWFSLIDDPRRLEMLEKRVEIAFSPTQPRQFAADAPVKVEVETKNVPTLLLKVFVIDSYRFLTERQKEVDATIELDGLIANHEETFHYEEPPLRRVHRTFDLPMLREPGTYVVELVGNGISSRAVIHKGSLRHTERTAAGGHVFRIYDENGTVHKDGLLWFGGREYRADENGDILVPFASKPGRKTAVLRAGRRTGLVTFEHAAEEFALDASAFIERESLVAGQKARIAVRPELSISGHSVSLKLLRDAVLDIVAEDIDGTKRTDEVREIALTDDREFVHVITVPDRLQSLSVRLRGKVENMKGEEVTLTASTTTFPINGIDKTKETVEPLLIPTSAGYAIELRGKNGEIAAGRPCTIRMMHRDLREPVTASLQTGADGRITLGPLPGITGIAVHVHGGPRISFELDEPTCTLPAVLQGRAGETLRLPYQGLSTAPTRAEFSLLAHDADAFEHLAIADGFLEIRDLSPGDYELWLHRRGALVRVRVTDGPADDGWILGNNRILQASSTEPLHLRTVRIAGEDLQIALTNFSDDTRVHVIGTRFQPTFSAFALLRGAHREGLSWWRTESVLSSYHAGRKLGDEYRYVLERRFVTKFAGNMLQRPGLLLNPWALERNSWNRAIGLGGGAGGKYGGRRASRRMRSGASRDADQGQGTTAAGMFANLDYLPKAAGAVFNLRPDERGIVTIPLADLGAGQVLHVVAIDGEEALYDRVVREEAPLEPRGRALAEALPSEAHFVEQKRIEFVAAGGKCVIGDSRSSEVEIFDTLGDVYRLLATASGNGDWQEFAFITEWPGFDEEAKRKLYSEHACHELNFFLYEKDRPFFDAVVRPFLANKLQKTFLDEWLLGLDLQPYLEPWAFAHLNLIEKILLAQRLGGDERKTVARLVTEQLELNPIDRGELDKLFDMALAANELNEQQGDATVLFETLNKMRRELRTGGGKPQNAPEESAAAPGAPPPPSKKDRRDADRKHDGGEFKANEPVTEAEEVEGDSVDDGFLAGTKRRKQLAREKAKEINARGRVANLFRPVKPTKILVESNYWRRSIGQTRPDVVKANHFWRDYATTAPGEPFVSAAFAETRNSFLEMMFALSVLDLPFEAGDHDVIVDGNRRILRPATPLLLVRKEVAPSEIADDEPPLLLGENFFRLDERYQLVEGERREKFVTGEFLTGTPYGAQVVVSNPTGRRRTIDVLLQIPEGALPVNGSFWTRSIPVTLDPYQTQSIEYAFYFPTPGDFGHYPAHAASNGRLVAAAAATGDELHVVAVPSRVDTRSWQHVSQQGTNAEVLTFLENNNLQGISLPKIAWRMKDREFFLAVTDLLRRHHVYDHTLWSYALLHRHVACTREFLRHADRFLRRCGDALDSELLSFDPTERRVFEHMEFDPLVRARAHRLGGEHRIGNADLARQYSRLLRILGYHPRLSSEDWLVVTYYLLLQDRIEEALKTANKIVPAELETQVQFDYLTAYLCFFTGETQKARELAERHREHPIAHWRKRFRDVIAQLDEAEGKTSEDTAEQAPDVARTAPALEFVLDGQTARIAYRNIDRCEVRYYELDVEFAFSARPFASTDGTSAPYVEPNLRETRTLPSDKDALTFDLPEQFRNKNVLVEVRASGLRRSNTYFANSLDVRFLESYGQVVVTDPARHRPLPKTYVKVFARLPNGTIRFHKDGYTDLRGRFDYASLSDDPNRNANRYAVLVLSEDYGAVIRDVAPPMQ